MIMRTLGLVLLGVVVCGASVRRAGGEESDADQAAFANFQEDFTSAWNRHDAPALAALWAEDGDLIDPQGTVAQGRSAVADLLEGALSPDGSCGQSSYEITSAAYRLVAPNVAVADWQVTLHDVLTGAHAPLADQSNRVVLVLIKRDGVWRLASARPSRLFFAEPEVTIEEAPPLE